MGKLKVNDKMYWVSRGGSWFFYPSILRSADRNWLVPVNRGNYLGFRILTQPDTHHVIRGGSWASISLNMRSANRTELYEPGYLSGTISFRITMEKS